MTRNVRPSVRWSKVICKQPGSYIGWPTIGRTADGELLAVFSGDRETHVCPYGKNQMIRSRDGGETWTEAETINSSPLDDRDTGLLVTRSGTLLITWFTGTSYADPERYRERYPESSDAWVRHWLKIPQDDRERYHGHWSRRSTDGGKSWNAAVDTIVTAPHGPIQLRDGRLLMVGNTRMGSRPVVASAESTDEGRSWSMSGIVPLPAEKAADAPYFNEPHLVELPDGSLVYLIRYGPPREPYDEWYLHQSESADGGRTWTSAHPTPIWGKPPHLILLDGGSLLATYGFRRPPFGERACLSHDGGLTWDIDNEIILRDDAPSDDLGYPASIELEPGEILTVYYQVEREGEKTCLMATRWGLGSGVG
jgi:hypothetical protein